MNEKYLISLLDEIIFLLDHMDKEQVKNRVKQIKTEVRTGLVPYKIIEENQKN
jgi:hypothetical protein